MYIYIENGSFSGSRQNHPHQLSSKGPNCQRRVLLISAGVIEGRFEGNTPTPWEGHQRVLFLHDNAPSHQALATQNKLAYLGLQCLDHSLYSPDLSPSDYHVFPGLKKKIERSPCFVRRGGNCCRGDLVGRTAFWIFLFFILLWLLFFFLSGLQKLEQRAKKCIELRGEYVE